MPRMDSSFCTVNGYGGIDSSSLANPSRVKKLTKFFGDEPPLLRMFLKKLGYEVIIKFVFALVQHNFLFTIIFVNSIFKYFFRNMHHFLKMKGLVLQNFHS